MMIPSMLEKIGYPVALIVLHLQNRIAPRMFALGSLDWIFLILFSIAYKKTQPRGGLRPASVTHSRRRP